MSTRYYQTKTITGEMATYRRHKKQGRPKSPQKDVNICVSISPTALPLIDKKAKDNNMSRSAWLELSGVLFTI